MSKVLLLFAVLAGWYARERRHRRMHPMSAGLHPEITLPHVAEWELYHNALSLCSKKLRICLAELGISYAGHHVDLIETGSYENISRRFLAVNPAGLVPVLVHEGHPVFESHEQIVYAAERAVGKAVLIPADPAARAAMDRWVDLASLYGDDPAADLPRSAGNCVPGLTIPLFAAMVVDIPYRRIVEGLLFHRLKIRPLMFLLLKATGLARLHGLGRVRDVVVASRTHMGRHLDGLEQQLGESGGPWILGDTYSLADVSWAVIFERLAEAAWLSLFLSPDRPRVTEYWARLKARPSYAAAITAFGHPGIERGHRRIVDEKARNPALRALYGEPG